MPPNIIGFRKTFSVQHGLKTLSLAVQSAFQRNKPLYASFFDVESAYQRTDLTKLLSILQQYKVPYNFLLLFWNLLRQRTIQILFNDQYSAKHIINTGLPQGFCSSAFLFAIYLIDIGRLQFPNGQILIYADDITFLYAPPDHSVIQFRIFERQLQQIRDALRKLNLELSSSKSSIMIFSKTNQPLNLRHNRLTDFPLVTTVKYLGIRFTDKFK